jgi:hypothetical protein
MKKHIYMGPSPGHTKNKTKKRISIDVTYLFLFIFIIYMCRLNIYANVRIPPKFKSCSQLPTKITKTKLFEKTTSIHKRDIKRLFIG